MHKIASATVGVGLAVAAPLAIATPASAADTASEQATSDESIVTSVGHVLPADQVNGLASKVGAENVTPELLAQLESVEQQLGGATGLL